MLVYKKDDITVSTVEEQDISDVVKLYSANDFTADYEASSLRPTNYQFITLMRDIIDGKVNTESVLVLKKNDKVIGYISMFVQYSRLNIGHIAICDTEQHQGYGKLLTRLAMLLAENDDRDVSLFCDHRKNYYSELGFEALDNVHYLYEHKGIKTEELPHLFLSIDEYEKKAEKDRMHKIESFRKTIDFLQKNGIGL